MKSIYEHQPVGSGMGFVVKEYRQTHFTSPFHFHDFYELILIVKSYGKLYVGNKVLNFNQDEIYLFGPGLPHCFYNFYNDKTFVNKSEMAYAIVIFFKKDFLGKDFFLNNDLIKTGGLLQKSSLGIKILATDTILTSLFEKIPNRKGLEALIIFLQLLNLLSNQRKNMRLINTELSKTMLSDDDSTRLEPVLKYIFENFKNDLTLKEAASLACLNSAAFCRYFKSRTEETFSQFVNRVRITHAVKLLALEKWNISDICYECGYQNVSYFNRQFKNIIGQTPLTYRKNLLYPDKDLLTQSEEMVY